MVRDYLNSLISETLYRTGAVGEDEIEKNWRYVDSPEEAPEGVDLEEGPQGGLRYWVGGGGQATAEDYDHVGDLGALEEVSDLQGIMSGMDEFDDEMVDAINWEGLSSMDWDQQQEFLGEAAQILSGDYEDPNAEDMSEAFSHLLGSWGSMVPGGDVGDDGDGGGQDPYRDDWDPDPRTEAPTFDSVDDLQDHMGEYQERVTEAMGEGAGEALLPEDGLPEDFYNAYHDIMTAGGDEMVAALQEAIHMGDYTDDLYDGYQDIMEDMELAAQMM